MVLPNHIIFGIKSDFPMSRKEVPRRDYYINLGTDSGIKKGSVLDVYRTVTTTDNINNRSSKSIQFVIARVRVIHADENISVGRIIEMLPPSDIPIAILNTVIVGDRVEISRK